MPPTIRRTAQNKSARAIDWSRLHREAVERFGIRHFRPGQREVIEAVLAGRDVLAIMPTGAGKSLTYQLPALLLPKATVVVSPLIALMQDQQLKAEDANIGAATLNSTLTRTETRDAVEEISAGEHDLVYVTPERLDNAEYRDLLRHAGVSLFVVDEAHCISQWGHDFRPAYLALRNAIQDIGRPPVLALTATATPDVSDDIVKQLSLDNPVVINTGIERENLSFEVFRTVNGEAKRARLKQVIEEADGVGIVYTATVRLANELWRWLKDEGINAGRYHAKCKVREREETQQRFMNNEYRVMVATKAFGLGIDKKDITFVLHYNFPDSLESYYQEAGRAGRDGKPASCTLLYRLEDRRIQGYFLGGKYPRREHSLKVYQAIEQMLNPPQPSEPTPASTQPDHHLSQHPSTADPGERPVRSSGLKLADLITAAGLPKRRVQVIVAQLESAGILAHRNRRLVKARDFANPEEFGDFLTQYERRGRSDRERLQAMMRYAETTECRMRYLAQYFGDDVSEECGHCDNCRARQAGTLPNEVRYSKGKKRQSAVTTAAPPQIGETCAVAFAQLPVAAPVSPPPEPELFSIGDHVLHRNFGSGEVIEISGDNVSVKFPKSTKRVRAEFLKAA